MKTHSNARRQLERLDSRHLLSGVTLTPRVITYEGVVQSAVGGDLDGDGDADVIAASEVGIAWYENTDGRHHG